MVTACHRAKYFGELPLLALSCTFVTLAYTQSHRIADPQYPSEIFQHQEKPCSIGSIYRIIWNPPISNKSAKPASCGRQGAFGEKMRLSLWFYNNHSAETADTFWTTEIHEANFVPSSTFLRPFTSSCICCDARRQDIPSTSLFQTNGKWRCLSNHGMVSLHVCFN